MILLFVVLIGLVLIVGCGYWVMSGVSLEGSFRVQAPNLKVCPQCGTPLDQNLDYCPKCSIRTSV